MRRIASESKRLTHYTPSGNAVHTLSFFTVLNAQEVLVAQTQTQCNASSRTEFTTALSVDADGSAAFVASAAWLSTFELSSVEGSVESEIVCERAQPSAGSGAQRSVDIVVVMEHSLDFDFGLKVSVQCYARAVTANHAI